MDNLLKKQLLTSTISFYSLNLQKILSGGLGKSSRPLNLDHASMLYFTPLALVCAQTPLLQKNRRVFFRRGCDCAQATFAHMVLIGGNFKIFRLFVKHAEGQIFLILL